MTTPVFNVTVREGSVSLVFSHSNMLQTVYLDELPFYFETEAQKKTDSAYAVHIANSQTTNIGKIIESGRLCVLKVKDGSLQGILVHPKLQLLSDISNFILFMDNKGSKSSVIINKMNIGRLNEDQYKKLSSKLKN